MSAGLNEDVVEDAALDWLGAMGWGVLHGPDIAVGEPAAERSDPTYRDVMLEGRLRGALARLNPDLPPEALEDAYRKLTRLEAPSLIERNRALHRMLVDGVTVEYRREDGSIGGAQACVIDFSDPEKNDWLTVNQFTVSEGQHTRRPDVVLFLNGFARREPSPEDQATPRRKRMPGRTFPLETEGYALEDLSPLGDARRTGRNFCGSADGHVAITATSRPEGLEHSLYLRNIVSPGWNFLILAKSPSRPIWAIGLCRLSQ